MNPGVVVSGASTGIGLAAVEALASSGWIAFAGVRSDEDAQRLASIGENVRPVMLDVTDEASLAAAERYVRESGVELLGIVSNAGIALGGPLETIPLAELRRQFDVNVFGALRMAQVFLPSLPVHRGRVVFVGSIAGRLATPYIGPYSASKFALRSLADSLRVELAPVGISVSLIEPGSVKTPIWQKGRAARERLYEQLGERPREHYRAAVDRVIEMTNDEERSGLPVESVTQVILHALTAAKPRGSYLVGAPARMGSVFATLPASLRAQLLRRAMRLP